MFDHQGSEPTRLNQRRHLTQSVRTEARRLGFSLVGVTTPQTPPHWSVYETWLAQGRHGEMHYLADDRARQLRADPRQILPECQSILVLGIPYWSAVPGDESSTQRHGSKVAVLSDNIAVLSDNIAVLSDVDPEGEKKDTEGRVACYAWGEDYHQVLPAKMQAVVDFIERQTGSPVPNRWYTDTGPILERDLAQLAGLGWIGKNTCLINPRSGSYFFLAEILLGVDLEPDEPFLDDLCGSCRRCLDACPTQSILPDRTLDARRCISYLTIELKGSIPLELRTQIGDWVFGCDICQQVCPWNIRFAPLSGDPSFAPRPDIPDPDLPGELKLTPEQFSRKFKDSPVKRAKRRGYLRNVAVVMGNKEYLAHDRDAMEVLAMALLHEPEALVRLHAAWALGQLGGLQAEHTLQQALANETDQNVIEAIDRTLRMIQGAD